MVADVNSRIPKFMLQNTKPVHLHLLTLQYQQNGVTKMNEEDVVFDTMQMRVLTKLESNRHFNCKPQYLYFSEYVVDRDSPISALIVSLAGSCTCGTKEYSSGKTRQHQIQLVEFV